MHLKTIGAGALCGLTGLVAGCSDAAKRPDTPAVMSAKQPNGNPVGIQAPGAVAANPPALRVGQPVGGPASPFAAGGATMQMPTAPNPNPSPAVVTSMPVSNPGTYGIAQAPPAPALPTSPYSTPLTPVQYQGSPVPMPASNMARPQAAPPMQVSGIPPMMPSIPMPPATALPPANPPAMAPAMSMAPPATNVVPTAVPSLPPLPTSPPTSAPPFPVIKPMEPVPAPSLPPLPSGAGMTLPELDRSGAQLPPMGSYPAPVPAVPGSVKPTTFRDLPPQVTTLPPVDLNAFPPPGQPR